MGFLCLVFQRLPASAGLSACSAVWIQDPWMPEYGMWWVEVSIEVRVHGLTLVVIHEGGVNPKPSTLNPNPQPPTLRLGGVRLVSPESRSSD